MSSTATAATSSATAASAASSATPASSAASSADPHSSYPVITALENADTSYRNMVSQYSSLYAQYIDDVSSGRTVNTGEKQRMMTQLVADMETKLGEMNRLLNEAYSDGMTNQHLSSEASNALALQSSLIDMRMKQYKEARDSLAKVVGEETTSRMTVTQNRYVYYVYFIFAFALCASIIYMVMGGTLPFGLLIILLVLGFFIGWEFYKSWLARMGSGISLGAMNVKGVFRIVT